MNLLDAKRAEYSRSESCLYGTLAVGAGLYILTALNTFALFGAAVSGIAVVAAIAQVVSFILRRVSQQHYSQAERIRRMEMRRDGLSIVPSEAELAELRYEVGDTASIESAFVAPYYASEEPKGPRRLIENIQESAFFTSKEARLCFLIGLGMVLVGVTVAFMSVVLPIFWGLKRPALEIMAQTALTGLVSWATGDIADMSWRYFQLERATANVMTRCEHALQLEQGDLMNRAVTILDEYNSAVLEAPVIPEWVYKKLQQRLNEAWRTRKQAFALES